MPSVPTLIPEIVTLLVFPSVLFQTCPPSRSYCISWVPPIAYSLVLDKEIAAIPGVPVCQTAGGCHFTFGGTITSEANIAIGTSPTRTIRRRAGILNTLMAVQWPGKYQLLLDHNRRK